MRRIVILVIGMVFVCSCSMDETVDLSGKHLRKEDFFVKLQSQIKLEQVTELILRDNEFDSFLDCSTNLDHLKVLDLSRNHLQRFFFLCKSEYNLEVLNVSYNQLEYIDDKALNNRITKLKILDLSFNKLDIVNETMLGPFQVLEYLSLSNNPIGEGIHDRAFANLTSLKHLDLKNISAPFFYEQIFDTMNVLSTLDLSFNPITSVPNLPSSLESLDLSGTHIVKIPSMYLQLLRELKLNRLPNITYLPLNQLANLTSLEILELNGCKNLSKIHANNLYDHALTKLQRLSMKDCAIDALESNLGPLLKRLSVIDLSNNPWRCDCGIRWINRMKTNTNVTFRIRCKNPIQHRGLFLAVVPESELVCDQPLAVVHSIFFVSLSIVIVLASLGVAVILFRRPLISCAKRKRNRETVSYKNVVECSNDMVRILPSNEE